MKGSLVAIVDIVFIALCSCRSVHVAADTRIMPGMTDEAWLRTQFTSQVPRERWLRNLETIKLLRDSRGSAEVEDGCPTVFSDGLPDECYEPQLGSWYHSEFSTCAPADSSACCTAVAGGDTDNDFFHQNCQSCNFVVARSERICLTMYRPMACMRPCVSGQ